MSTTSILVLLGINLVYGFITPGVSWQGHIGGFLLGLVVTGVYILVADRSRPGGRGAQMKWSALATAIMVAVFSAATWGLLHAAVAAVA